MPLLKGKENIGHNVETEEKTHPKKQAVAIALREAKDTGMVTAPNAGIPAGHIKAEDGSYSVGDMWTGKRS